MGRKPDPRGKDRPRTIVLAGDVAEIAQKLADKGLLSSTISELIRHTYGFGDAIEEKKRELEATIEERRLLKDREEHIIANIEALEAQALERNTTIIPALEQKVEILEARYNKLGRDLQRSFDHQTRQRKLKQHQEVFDLLNAARMELRDAQ